MSAPRRHVVRVRIMGEDYTLRTEASEAHTRAVAAHVDRTIRALMESGGVIETQKAAILAALQITDDLFRERMAGEVLAADMRRLTEELRPLLPPDRRHEDDEGRPAD